MRKVFISHTKKDAMFVEELAKNLMRADFTVWYSEWEIAVGDSIIQKIEDGLGIADCLIVVLSTASVTSFWVRQELEAGLVISRERKAFVLPLLLEECDIPPFLRAKGLLDFTGDPLSAFGRLTNEIDPEDNFPRVDWRPLNHLDALDVCSNMLKCILADCTRECCSEKSTHEAVARKFAEIAEFWEIPTKMLRLYVALCIKKRRCLTMGEFIRASVIYATQNECTREDFDNIKEWLECVASG